MDYRAFEVGLIPGLLANGGTPFIWFGLLWLTVGNLAIAGLEALVLARGFGVPSSEGYPVLVAANFGTALLGYLVGPWLLGWSAWLAEVGAGREVMVVALAWFVTFAATVLVEAVVLRGFLRGIDRWRTAFKASLAANAVSYTVLVPFALMISVWDGPVLLRQLDTVGQLTRTPPSGVVVYVAASNTSIQRRPLNGGPPKEVVALNTSLASNWWDALYVAVSPTGRRHLKWSSTPEPTTDPTLILDFLPGGVTEATKLRADGWEAPIVNDSFARSFPGSDRYRVLTMRWPGHNFEVFDKLKRRSFGLGFQSPFLAWFWSNHTVLPDGWCVAERGGKVLLIDLDRLESAPLTRGHGALVVLKPTL